MSAPGSRDLLIINTAAFLRSFTFGLTGVVLGIYLFRVGLSSFNIGMIVAAGDCRMSKSPQSGKGDRDVIYRSRGWVNHGFRGRQFRRTRG
jgi:hypothetical protein